MKKAGTLDWARPFPADASSKSRANEGPASSALAHGPWPTGHTLTSLIADAVGIADSVEKNHSILIANTLSLEIYNLIFLNKQ